MPISSKLTIRQSIISTCRQFFLDHNFTEVTVPILTPSLPAEPNIYPFITKWTPSQGKAINYYLATSPETYLKKLISQGLGDCFAISPCFRNLENIGPHHNPEFLMLEWYQIGKNYRDVIFTTQQLLKTFNFNNFKNLSLKKFFKTYPDNEPDFNQQFLNQVEPNLPTDPVFLTDYPAYLSPLAAEQEPVEINFSARSHNAKSISVSTAKIRSQGRLAQRFELYINRVEIANGCTENLHPSITVPWGPIPPCAGCGLGLDRLAMLTSNDSSIWQP